jgi:hypothetical protein
VHAINTIKCFLAENILKGIDFPKIIFQLKPFYVEVEVNGAERKKEK